MLPSRVDSQHHAPGGHGVEGFNRAPLCESKLGPDHPITATCRNNLSAASAATDRPAKAMPLKGKLKTAQSQADLAASPVNLQLLRVRRLAEQKRSKEAEAALAKIAELPSNDAQGYRERGRTYFALGLADKATADFRKAAEFLDERALLLLGPPSKPTASEADKLFARVAEDVLLAKLTAAIERNPDDVARRWSRGERCACRARDYVRLSQWDQAAAEYAKADLLMWALGDDAFGYACLLLIRGESEGYDRFCQGMIKRAGQTEDHFEAFILARTCAMARKTPVDPARAVQWGKQAVASAQPAWYFHALGLAQYRAGQFDQALQTFAKADVKGWGCRDLNSFGLALVHDRLGHPDEARRCLDKGIQWLEREGPSSPERPTQLMPQDWLEAQLLRREAEEMLKTKRSP